MEKITIHFTREKDTKNMARFKETPPAFEKEVVGTLYVNKLIIGDTQRLMVTLESA